MESLMLIKAFIYLIKNAEKNITISNIGFPFEYTWIYIIYFCDAVLNIHQPLLQSSVSRDPSEIILIYWFIISAEIVVLLNVFFLTGDVFSLILWWIKS